MTQKNPEVEAKKVQQAFGGGVPVNPISIAQLMDVKVMSVKFKDTAIDGAVRNVDGDRTIYVKEGLPPARARFTVAHEIGHIIANEDDESKSYGYIDYRRQMCGTTGTDEEKFANAFAAALLMPADKVRDAVKFFESTSSLAEYFGVSSEAMTYRLQNLGLR